jgi:hypothetical protein
MELDGEGECGQDPGAVVDIPIKKQVVFEASAAEWRRLEIFHALADRELTLWK